ncbi:class I SAM-dependent methyltransferase [Rhizobium daejeonense]|nr:hypothetical protein [Rhizobium daejeonense]
MKAIFHPTSPYAIFSVAPCTPMTIKQGKTASISFSDTAAFFKEWMTDPARVGSLVPSSDRLSALITRHVDPAYGPVLELGPGTGVFTRMLIHRGVRQEDLTLVEFGHDFAASLKERFPAAKIICLDAGRLWHTRSDFPLHGAAVSGLPLLAMPRRKVFRIVRGAFALLDPSACLFQFTYGWRCPIPTVILDRLGLQAERVGTVVRNFPPASVYKVARR